VRELSKEGKTYIPKKEREAMVETLRIQENIEAGIENWFGKVKYQNYSDKFLREQVAFAVMRKVKGETK